MLKSQYIFKNFIYFIFNWSVYPLISSTISGPLPELELQLCAGRHHSLAQAGGSSQYEPFSAESADWSFSVLLCCRRLHKSRGLQFCACSQHSLADSVSIFHGETSNFNNVYSDFGKSCGCQVALFAIQGALLCQVSPSRIITVPRCRVWVGPEEPAQVT